jgi:site-specific recombinase XerD
LIIRDNAAGAPYGGRSVALTQRADCGSERTWTVVDADYSTVVPAEQFLEYLRCQEYSPNTVKSYARALALWWTFLEHCDLDWDRVQLGDVAAFVRRLRNCSVEEAVEPLMAVCRASDATVAVRVRAVLSFYRYHAAAGMGPGAAMFETVRTRPSRHLVFLEHIARRHGRRRSVVRVPGRAQWKGPLPLVSPGQLASLCDTEASWDAGTNVFHGDVRYRLLWSLLAETGMRLGEALSIQHRDWKMGTGQTAVVEIVPRLHPHRLAAKSGFRAVHVSNRLDRLYGELVWQLCDLGADAVLDDWDGAYVFCNMQREPMFEPLRPESVYAHLASMKRRLPGLPSGLTPHWFRHTHATALLLAGVPLHVVSRRLGHRDIQTTANTYAHVTEDAELRAVANWQDFLACWGVDGTQTWDTSPWP